ncbi:hypothetical protein LZ31DRAFT_597503 [Colletotrichum somersetense]|nr:hypothetical protein LZ31DRAFT_597503 [Colletotrichum somersetense]
MDFQYLGISTDQDYDSSDSRTPQDDTAMESQEKAIYESRQLMNDYVTAWKDFEFMTETRKNRGYDPFVIRSDWFLRRECLRDAYQHWLRPADQPRPVDREQGFAEFEKAMKVLREDHRGLKYKDRPVSMDGGTRSMRSKDDGFQVYTKKVLMALVGGVPLCAYACHGRVHRPDYLACHDFGLYHCFRSGHVFAGVLIGAV